jgi:hypothetical protein
VAAETLTDVIWLSGVAVGTSVRVPN